MLLASDFPVADALALLGRHGIEAALLVPTANGLAKSIMDAPQGLRQYLLETGYHDYSTQAQGQAAKVTRDVYFVGPRTLERSTASFYRPETKSGDPRIWLGTATKRNATALNLLALTVLQGELYALNMSDPRVRASLDDPSSPFRKALAAKRLASPIVDELLHKLRGICARGFIRTLRPGDTGVGMTLETLLGIRANSARAPDYRGVELKAKRRRRRSSENRSTLFSKVPAWRLSPVGSALGLLQRRGYLDASGRLQLYHQLDGGRPNSLGLMLEIDPQRQWLKQVFVPPKGEPEHDVTWELPVLEADLAAKHRETFWVAADCRGVGGDEEFHYIEVQHTRQPLVRNFAPLIEAGVISVDYLLHQEGTRARDHGYLFKIHPRNLGALFPPSEVHSLA